GMRVVAIPHGSYPLDGDAAGLAAVTLGSVDELTPEVVERLS
ncbi:HAD family phosphatase, partial [Micromonospora azadirachtae]